MKLLIVESPAKAKTISKYLDGQYTVKASIGHVRDLPKSNKKAINIAGGFVPHYEIAKGKEKVVAELEALAEKAKEVVLATDPDREGEAIAWHLSELLKLPKTKIKRATYHEITKEAIKEALEHTRGIDENLRRAQEARRVLDRLVGYDLSGLIWKKVRYGLSAGRVQSPALRILVEREREIKAFKPETFWRIFADFAAKAGTFRATSTVEPKTAEETERIIGAAKKAMWKVTEITETETRRAPRAPFTTSTLQQAASSRLGLSPSRTMRAAQKLYEAGRITYMRTDSTTLAQSALAEIKKAVESAYGAKHYEGRQYATKSKNAQEAHEAIRPTHFSNTSAGYTADEKRLYELIFRRTIASQMKDAKILRTTITAGSSDQTIPAFTANGSRTLYKGWLLADPISAGEDVELPKAIKDETLNLKDITSEEKQTEPPSRYSEAGLIKELEKRGIGRPSTYASIIDTIERRGYVENIGRSLKPTDVGEVVSTFLEENFAEYISDTFTAGMENELDEIANGEREYEKTLSDFYKPFAKAVKSKEKTAKLTSLGDAPEFKCPICGKEMEWKLSRGGKFISCKRFPDCNGALTSDGKEIQKERPIGIDPVTGLPIFVMDGRFGPYVQLGETSKTKKPRRAGELVKVESGNKNGDDSSSAKLVKPKRVSIPKTADPSKVTVADALKYLSLPRILGVNPKTGKEVTASVGRFGPYIVHENDFRSLKVPDDVYTIPLARALEILATPKLTRKGRSFKISKKSTKEKFPRV